MVGDILYNLKDKGVKTLDWEQYKFDSQYQDGSEVLINVAVDALTGVRAEMVTCDTRLDFILGIRNLKRKYGDDAKIYFAQKKPLKTTGLAVLALGDVVIDNESDLNESQVKDLMDYSKKVIRLVEDKGVTLKWGILEDESLIIVGIQ